MYTLEEEIIHFVFKAFHGMERKKEKIALSFHSIMVGNMLKNIQCEDDIVYIGYLHDVIEDTEYTYEDVCDKFGKKIADGVMALSEDKSITTYRERKETFLEKLKNIDINLLVVEVADKLQNLMSDYNLFLEKGKDSLMTESDNFSNFKWYYMSLRDLFNQRLNNNVLLDRYNEIIDLYFFEK